MSITEKRVKTRIERMREEFEKTNNRNDSELLQFGGCGDKTIYNCSIPP